MTESDGHAEKGAHCARPEAVRLQFTSDCVGKIRPSVLMPCSVRRLDRLYLHGLHASENGRIGDGVVNMRWKACVTGVRVRTCGDPVGPKPNCGSIRDEVTDLPRNERAFDFTNPHSMSFNRLGA